MANKIQIKRGLIGTIPILSDGELGYPTDQPGKLYIGNGGTNRLIGDGVYPTLNGTGATGTWGIGISGVAATATVLATARTINGVSFDGSANITVYDATKLPLTGGTMTGALTLQADPSNALHAATKQYVDAVAVGLLDFKASCRAVATTNITLSAPQTIDGVSIIAGDRVLVVGQTTGSANGIYVVTAGAWARSSDADISTKVTAGMFTWIEEGTSYGNTGWILSTNNPITLDTTSLTFVQFSGAGQITAGNGLTKTGNTLDVVSSGNGIVVNADNIALTYGTALNTVCQGNDSRLHTQNTDIGTTSQGFQLWSGSNGVIIRHSGIPGSNEVEIVNYDLSSKALLKVAGVACYGIPNVQGAISMYNAAKTFRMQLAWTGVADRNFAFPDNSGVYIITDASTLDCGTW